jgi:hypothetical protein
VQITSFIERRQTTAGVSSEVGEKINTIFLGRLFLSKPTVFSVAYFQPSDQIDGEYESQQFLSNLQVHRKMARKQLPLGLTRLVSHPGFFLFCFLFLFSNSSFFTALLPSLLIITVINCSSLQVHEAKLTDMFDAMH